MRRVLTTLTTVAGLVLCLVVVSVATTERLFFGLLASAPPGSGEGARPERPPPRVAVATVAREAVPVTLEFSGRLLAKRTAELRARVTGTVVSRGFEEAEFVEAERTLFTLDRRPFEARVAELRAAVEGAEARLSFLAEEVDRISQLEDQSFATESNLDDLISQRDGQAARVDELAATLRRAELDLEFATIEAPFDGKADFAAVDEGDLVSAGETVLTRLVQYDPIEVEIRPSAAQVAQLTGHLERTGAPIRVTVRLEGREERFEGEIGGLGPAFETATNTLPVRAELPNPERILVPGQFARVTAHLGERQALLVPSEALIVDQDQRALLRVGAEGKLAVVPVETAGIYGTRTAVVGEIAAGERIVTDNLQGLRPGMAVEIREEDAGEREAGARAQAGAGEGR